MKVICGRDAEATSRRRPSNSAGKKPPPTGARSSTGRTSTSSTSARRATATPRSRSRPPGRARWCSARSRSPTRCAEAQQMLAAVKKAGVVHMICHNYRRAPAVMLAQAADRGGQARHDSITTAAPTCRTGSPIPSVPARLAAAEGRRPGSGALGDIASHSLDLARFLVGEITEVTGRTRDVRQGTAAARQPEEEGHGHRRRCVGVARALRQRRAGHDRGDALRARAGRTTTASRSTAARARSRSISSG